MVRLSHAAGTGGVTTRELLDVATVSGHHQHVRLGNREAVHAPLVAQPAEA